jgi:hypothetical protein
MSKAKEKFETALWERVLQKFAAGVPAEEVDTKHLEAIYAFTLEETLKSYRYGKARTAVTRSKPVVPRIPRPDHAVSRPSDDEDDLDSE